MWSPPRDARNVTEVGFCTGTLDGLVGSHTRLAIYPTLTIHCWRGVIRALLNTRFKGMQVVTYPANVKQLKSHWLEVPQKGLGTCIWINKSHNPFWFMLCSTRGTEIAEVEGLWFVYRPKCLVSEDPDDSPKVQLCPTFKVPSLNSMRDPCDVISWSSQLSALIFQWENHCASTLETSPFVCTSADVHTRTPNTIIASEPLHLFLNPIFMSVTCIYIWTYIWTDHYWMEILQWNESIWKWKYEDGNI